VKTTRDADPCLDALLADARGSGLDRLDAELLAAHVLGIARSAVIAHPERRLTAQEAARIAALHARRVAGEPFAQLVGRAGFHTLDLEITADVLIPRADTETLVDAVLERLPQTPLRGLDLGCGSGAVALALAAARPSWSLVAVDLSPEACALTRRNAERLGLDERVEVRCGNWYEPVAGACWDLIVSNPPYVADADPELEADVRAHEPAQALFAGEDGLDALRSILAAPPLAGGGLIAVEHGHSQGEAVRALMAAASLEDAATISDLAGRDRVTLARAPRHG
jgi:release factor glutamine methyltransferase